MLDIKEKLVELLHDFGTIDGCVILSPSGCNDCPYRYEENCDSKALADHLIANGVTIQQWISVEERLPERKDQKHKRDFYLVTLSNGMVKELAYEHDDYDNMLFDPGWHPTSSPVTHWMPLPEPPKGE